MFGIAKTCRHELTPELHRQYRAHMCGLCLSLRDHHGQLSRAVTNVDAVVLSVLVEAQRDERLAHVDAGPCPLRGMQPASVVASGEDALAHGAAVSLLAASVKIRDHAVDHDGVVGRVPGTSVRVARRLDAAGRGRAAAAGFDAVVFDEAVDASSVVERRHGLRFEEWSAPTEVAMAAAARHTGVLAGRPENAAALGELGAMFGRLTYLLDAVEDEAEDLAAGRFNAMVAAHPDPVGRREEAQRVFTDAHDRLAAAFDRLELAHPELARHLLVDQLGRRGRRIVGLSVAHSCPTHHRHHGRRHHPERPAGVRGAFAGAAATAVALVAGTASLGTSWLVGGGPEQEKKSRDCCLEGCCDCCDCCDCCGDCDGCDCDCSP